ncbi:MAG: glycosyltransferase [Bdellovibrio sp.]
MNLFVELLSARPNESPHLRINLHLFKYILEDHPSIVLRPFATSEMVVWYENALPKLLGNSQWQPVVVAKIWANPYLRILFNMVIAPTLFIKNKIDVAIWSTPGLIPPVPGTHQVQRLSNLLPIVDPLSYRNPLQRLFNFIAARVACRRCEMVVANTQYTRGYIMKYTGAPEHRIAVIPEATDENIVETLRPAQFPFEKTVDIVIPSGLYWHKHISLGLKVARLASKKIGRRLTVWILGGKHPAYHSHLLTEFSEEFSSGQFIYKGRIPKEEVWRAIASAKVVLYPSRYESFGIPPLEAMILGTPVLLSRIASHEEVCGQAATFHEPGSVEDATHKLIPLLAGADAQIQRQFEHVKKFSWRKITRQTVEQLEELLKENKSNARVV